MRLGGGCGQGGGVLGRPGHLHPGHVGGALADQTGLVEDLAELKDFYAELPIKIRLTGSYHQFGEFVSGIAALPRIVTLHDIDIKSDNKDAYDQLSLELTAKTYRYMDEDEIAAGETDKKDVTHRAKPAGPASPAG